MEVVAHVGIGHKKGFPFNTLPVMQLVLEIVLIVAEPAGIPNFVLLKNSGTNPEKRLSFMVNCEKLKLPISGDIVPVNYITVSTAPKYGYIPYL